MHTVRFWAELAERTHATSLIAYCVKWTIPGSLNRCCTCPHVFLESSAELFSYRELDESIQHKLIHVLCVAYFNSAPESIKALHRQAKITSKISLYWTVHIVSGSRTKHHEGSHHLFYCMQSVRCSLHGIPHLWLWGQCSMACQCASFWLWWDCLPPGWSVVPSLFVWPPKRYVVID